MTPGDWAGLLCWQRMSFEQQERLVVTGRFDGYDDNPDPDACTRPATVAVETATDRAPGPMAYCAAHAIERIRDL